MFQEINAPEPDGGDEALMEDLERYDHIFGVDQLEAVKECLTQLAQAREGHASILATDGLRIILLEAHQFEQRLVKLEKVRVSRVAERLEATGASLLNAFAAAIRLEFPQQGRPKGGIGDRDYYIRAVCDVYERLTGRRPARTWNEHATAPNGDPRPRSEGKLLELLRACLAPELFWERGHPLRDEAIVSAVRRIVKRRSD